MDIVAEVMRPQDFVIVNVKMRKIMDREFIEETHTYWAGNTNYPSVTTILQEAGLTNKNRFYDDFSRTRGVYVHKAIELYNKGELAEDDLDERLSPYLMAWKNFKENSNIEIIESEKMLFNDLYKYAGRLDIVCQINREDSIIDLKSGQVDAVTALQLAGYAMALSPDSYYSIRRYGLSLRGGKASIEPFTKPYDFYLWQALVAIYHYKLEAGMIKKPDKEGEDGS
jgi:hypothetical protein